MGTLLCFSLGKKLRGARFFRAAVTADPRALLPHLNLARLLAERKDPQAEQEFRRSLELQPGSPAAHFAYGKFLETQGKIDEAEEHYRRSFDLRPDDPTPAYELARLFVSLGEERRAQSWLERGDRITPTLPRSLADLATIFLTSPAPLLRRPEKAVVYAMRAVEQTEGNNPSHLATLAEALLATGNIQGATDVLRRALKLDCDDPSVATDLLRARMDLEKHGVVLDVPASLLRLAHRNVAPAPDQPDFPVREPGP